MEDECRSVPLTKCMRILNLWAFINNFQFSNQSPWSPSKLMFINFEVEWTVGQRCVVDRLPEATYPLNPSDWKATVKQNVNRLSHFRLWKEIRRNKKESAVLFTGTMSALNISLSRKNMWNGSKQSRASTQMRKSRCFLYFRRKVKVSCKQRPDTQSKVKGLLNLHP